MTSQKKLSSILFLLIVFISAAIKAQTQVPDTNKDYHHMSELDEKPDFPGGMQGFYDFIGANYQTPKVQGLAGKIYVTFIIEKDGSLADIKVLRDIGYGTGKEAIRVLQSCPKWIPGKYKGEPVRVLYSLPINIKATEKPEERIYSESEVFERPAYPGGLQNFYIDISKHFKTPEKEGLKGQLVIGFVIEKDGSIGKITILKDIGYGTGEEAMRCIKLIKNWTPGKLKDGTAVITAYSLPFTIQSAN
ncbi:energy transducer TonB [Flavobacterium hydrophilum]|uniref:energy transducer TonB n=1 Tax=Flavobacterium hydrophilum TaxID=2211445 RepID=UPI001403F789|nr:energy transducer TonB [Flavobacterium hydrophilum]